MKCNYRLFFRYKDEKTDFGAVDGKDKTEVSRSLVERVKAFIHKVADPKFEYEFLMSKLEGRVKFDEEGRFCTLDRMGKEELEVQAEIIEEKTT
jgi:hypothetical protein